MDLNLLQVFTAIYEEGSLTGAAHRLHLTQPTVSHACKKLRRQHGDPLFIRNGQGMTPTKRAHELYRDISPHLAALHGVIEASGHFDPQASTRKFTLALSDIGESLFLPEILHDLHVAAPQVTVDVIPVDTASTPELLARGTVDAVATTADLGPGTYSDAIKLDRYCFAHHPSLTKPISQGRFTDIGFVLVHPAHGHEEPIRRLREAGYDLAIRSVIQTFATVPPVVTRTPLASVVPETVARHWQQLWPTLKISPLPISSVELDVRLHRRDTPPAPDLEWFFTFTLQAMRKLNERSFDVEQAI